MTPGLLAIIEESKRLDGLATEGPWSKFGLTIQKETITNEPWTGCGYTSVIAEGFIHKLRGMSVEDAHSNAEFIAHSRNALPALVAEVERLSALVDALQIDLTNLACLGNGVAYGNSTGNKLAIDALRKIAESHGIQAREGR